MNAYGTKEYRDRFEKYKADTSGALIDRQKSLDFGKFKIGLTYYRTQKKFVCETARMEIFKDGKKIYECLCNEHVTEPSFYRYADKLWIFFRKDLYGYTLLNLDTLEERNYFPSSAIEGGEAFIPCEAAAIKDVLIFYGCYWASPYFYYLLSLADYRTCRLNFEAPEVCDIYEQGVRIEEGKLKFDYGIWNEELQEEQKKQAVFGYEELKKMLEESRTYDL